MRLYHWSVHTGRHRSITNVLSGFRLLDSYNLVPVQSLVWHQRILWQGSPRIDSSLQFQLVGLMREPPQI